MPLLSYADHGERAAGDVERHFRVVSGFLITLRTDPFDQTDLRAMATFEVISDSTRRPTRRGDISSAALAPRASRWLRSRAPISGAMPEAARLATSCAGPPAKVTGRRRSLT